MIEVIPSMPVQSFTELQTKLGIVRGLVKTAQIDICDGMFVTNRTWPMNPSDDAQFQRIVKGDEGLPYWEDFNFEVDLMLHNAEKVLKDWIHVGIVRALIHIETKHDFSACRALASDKIELGAAISLGTPIERLDEYIPYVDVVQIMGIAKIGIQGQPFDSRVIDAIKEVKKRYPDVTIEVDGAVNADTAPQMVEAGATRLAPGSYVLRSENPKEAVKALESLG